VPTGATVLVGDIKGKIGDTVKVPVSVTNVPNIASYQLNFNYDNAKLEMVSITNKLTDGEFQTNPDVITNVAGSVYVSWLYAEPTTVGPNVDLFEVSFKIRTGSSGTADVTVSDLLVIDDSTNEITVATDNGVVTIVTLSSITVDAVDPIIVGGSSQIKVTANYSDGTNEDVTSSASYDSSADSFATVSTSGLVSAVAVGSADITVTYGGKEDTVTVTVSPVPIKYGDINNSGIVTGADASIALKAAIGLLTLDQDDKQFIRADVNGDNKVDVKDAVLIIKFANGRITKFPVENID
jgi:hypothetical protein